MPDPEIKIKITREGIGQTTDDLGKVEKAAEKTDGRIRQVADGFKKAAREMPLLASGLDLIRNRYTALSAVVILFVTKFREYTAELNEMVSVVGRAQAPVDKTGDAFKTAAEGVKMMAEAMKDLKSYTDSVVAGLGNQIEAIEEQFAATEKLLAAQAELEKAKVDASEQDPVAKAKAKAAIDLNLEQTRLGLSGKKNQQAEIVGQQIERERQLQIEAGENVPREADVTAAVKTFEGDQQKYNAAFSANREAFGKAELLRRFKRDRMSPNFFKIFAPAEVRELQSMGLISGINEIGNTGAFRGQLKTNGDLADQMLPAAEAAQASARDSLARARTSLGASRAVLPPGVSKLADVEPYIDAANAAAAAVQNESYQRQESLMQKRGSLQRGAAVEIEIQRMRTFQTEISGQKDVRDAERTAEKIGDKFEAFMRVFGQRMDRVESAIKIQSQQ